MIIENQKVVSLNYNLTVKDKKGGNEVLVEQTEAENPFVFLFGSGGLLEAFENNLKGKKVADTFDFIIDYESGYGSRDETHVVNIPVQAFVAEDGSFDKEMIKVGNVVPMIDNEGHHLQGTVEEVTETFVRMDFNHPLAGQDLHFVGSVLEIRNATSEELQHGHVHGPGGHHH